MHNSYTNKKIAVAHHDLVTPAYLIEVKVVKELVKNILYNKLIVHRFSKQTNTEIKHQSKSETSTDQTISKTTSDYILKLFYS